MKLQFCEFHLISNGGIAFTRDEALQKMELAYKNVEQTLRSVTRVEGKEASKTAELLAKTSPWDNDSGGDDVAKKLRSVKEFSCFNASTWDRRELIVLRIRCMELLRKFSTITADRIFQGLTRHPFLAIDAQCPLRPANHTNHYHIMCCCNERSFCNFDVSI
ncbi:unnamed protein product [Gongylonema pulchrum]|uniref:PI3K/PI4K domain-containing protein n=1 Tax=Gongylonema pulchrum TaxID=637853 RepID=A0A183D101_9BILA|nr:unnamed protein product [Gongylonema pulchrum]